MATRLPRLPLGARIDYDIEEYKTSILCRNLKCKFNLAHYGLSNGRPACNLKRITISEDGNCNMMEKTE